MSRWASHLLVVAIFVAAFAAPASAASLKVGPARFIVHDVQPGRLYDLYKDTGLQLTLYNDDNVERVWQLSVHRPSERGTWETGYAEIPDASWCWFDTTTVTVPPSGQSNARIFFRIPDEERYYNQHWVVTLGVGGAPGRGGISLAADVRVQIETTTKTDVATQPDGPFALVPGKVFFEGVVPGETRKGEVRLYNNGSKQCRYTLRPLFGEVKDPTAYFTTGFSRIADPGFLKYTEAVSVNPGESAPISVELSIPAGAASLGKHWEELVLVVPEDGKAGFVRVQISTKESE